MSTRPCECDWDPEYHRDLNVRRGRPEAGASCTNYPMDEETYLQQGGICLPCIHGCPQEPEEAGA